MFALVAEVTQAVTPADSVEARAEAHVDAFFKGTKRVFSDAWTVLRLGVFIVYLALAVLSFWVWVFSLLFVLLRLLLHTVMTLLLWVSGGLPAGEGAADLSSVNKEIAHWWRTRGRYALFVYPAASHFVIAQRSTRRFFHWTPARKFLAVVTTMFCVIVPFIYVVPRPHYVQIVDNDVIEYTPDRKVRYLIHGVDLFELGQTREYQNEPVWWLGKVNEQGLKNQLQPGRFYRLWIVGIRWYYWPTLFPNILSATETDRQGKTLETPTHFVPAPQERSSQKN